MWTTKRTKPETAPTLPVERDYTFYYRAYYYTYRAASVSDARTQLRASLSAQADREATLTRVQ